MLTYGGAPKNLEYDLICTYFIRKLRAIFQWALFWGMADRNSFNWILDIGHTSCKNWSTRNKAELGIVD